MQQAASRVGECFCGSEIINYLACNCALKSLLLIFEKSERFDRLIIYRNNPTPEKGLDRNLYCYSCRDVGGSCVF